MTAQKDWTGNSKAIYSCHGASNHSETERETNDFYATPPVAAEMLLDLEDFSHDIWEPCCGQGHIAEVLKEHRYNVKATDLIDRGYGQGNVDFLQCTEPWNGDIITNFPYSMAAEMTMHAMDLLKDGHKLASFLKLTFLEGQGRKVLFDTYPPKTIYVARARFGCAKNGEFKVDKNGKLKADSAVCYCWMIWEKGFYGDPVVKWFN